MYKYPHAQYVKITRPSHIYRLIFLDLSQTRHSGADWPSNGMVRHPLAMSRRKSAEYDDIHCTYVVECTYSVRIGHSMHAQGDDCTTQYGRDQNNWQAHDHDIVLGCRCMLHASSGGVSVFHEESGLITGDVKQQTKRHQLSSSTNQTARRARHFSPPIRRSTQITGCLIRGG